MDLYLMILVLGLSFAVLFGVLSLLRREGVSLKFTMEACVISLLVSGVGYVTRSEVSPIFFLIFLYLITMRSRLLTDVATFLSSRGRQRDAIAILQVALGLWPDKQSRLIVLTNMGIVQLVRKNPASAEELLSSVLEQAKDGGLGMRHEAACRYNLAIALRNQGKDAQATRHFRETADGFPGSQYGKAALKALEERRSGKKKPDPDEPNE